MALNVNFDIASALISSHLEQQIRYRCLVIQSNEMAVLSTLSELVVAAASVLGEVSVLDALEQFDDIGALSCDTILKRVKAIPEQHPLVIAGPLHFLDYWSQPIRAHFWEHLASFSTGPGIVITDNFRNEGILGPFRVVDAFGRGDVKFLKSKLESTQDRLA